jgi:hypothetical protein
MGDVTTFGSEPWMVVSSTSSWPTAPPSTKRGDWSTSWNTTTSVSDKIPKASLQNQLHTTPEPNYDNIDKLLVPQFGGLTFVDTMSPNAWTAKPSETKKKKDEKVNIGNSLNAFSEIFRSHSLSSR